MAETNPATSSIGWLANRRTGHVPDGRRKQYRHHRSYRSRRDAKRRRRRVDESVEHFAARLRSH